MNKIYFAAAALATLAMTSCSNDDLDTANVNNNGTAKMQVRLSYDQLTSTRTSLDEVDNGELAASLNCAWKKGDKVRVYQDGQYLGELIVDDEFDGQTSALFNGTLQGVKDGENQTYNFFYVGDKDQAPFSYDYSAQSGKVEDLVNGDFLTATAQVSVADGYAYVADMGLKRHIAFAHFNIVFPEGVTYNNEEITVSGSNMGNAISVSATNEVTKTKGEIKVPTNDMYIIVVPDGESDIKFSCTIDGIDYEASLEGNHNWTASEFVNAGYQNGIKATVASKKYDYHVKYVLTNPLEADAEGSIVETTNISGAPSKYLFTLPNLETTTQNINIPADYWGYNITGWSLEKGGEAVESISMVNEEKEDNTYYLYAVWGVETRFEYHFIYDGNKPAGVSSDVILGANTENIYNAGNPYTHVVDPDQIPDPTLVNYEFLGWATEKDATTGKTEFEVKATGKKTTVKLYAVWEKKLTGGSLEPIPGAGW